MFDSETVTLMELSEAICSNWPERMETLRIIISVVLKKVEDPDPRSAI